MAIFGGKESSVFVVINQHLKSVEDTLRAFEKLIDAYLSSDLDSAKSYETVVEKLESEADRLRREIERMLYEGAFLPAHRGDYVRLSELVDQIADAAESAARTLMLAKPHVPDELSGEIKRLVSSAIRTYELLERAVRSLNEDVDVALELAKQTEDAEEAADRVEYDVKEKIFESESVTTYAKLVWNQVLTKVGDIADRAEDASDQVMLMAIKRGG